MTDMPLFNLSLTQKFFQKQQHAGEFVGGFALRAVAGMAAAVRSVEPRLRGSFAQFGVELERVGGMDAVVAEAGGNERWRIIDAV